MTSFQLVLMAPYPQLQLKDEGSLHKNKSANLMTSCKREGGVREWKHFIKYDKLWRELRGGIGENKQFHKSMTKKFLFLVRVLVVNIVLLHIKEILHTNEIFPPLNHHRPPSLSPATCLDI